MYFGGSSRDPVAADWHMLTGVRGRSVAGFLHTRGHRETE